jgi:hypothetical protein
MGILSSLLLDLQIMLAVVYGRLVEPLDIIYILKVVF